MLGFKGGGDDDVVVDNNSCLLLIIVGISVLVIERIFCDLLL